MPATPSLHALLDRSESMHRAWHDTLLGHAPPHPNELPLRHRLALDASALTLEHGQAIRLLLQDHLENAALALLRVQHEALLRAAWVAYAADDADLQPLAGPDTDLGVKQANALPLAGVLLKQVEASALTPAALKRGLREFRDIVWADANSYTHAGLLPLVRVGKRHAEAHLVQALYISNAHGYSASMISAEITDPADTLAAINRIVVAHPECMLMSWRARA